MADDRERRDQAVHNKFLPYDQEKENAAPDQEVGRNAVPETGQEPHDGQIEDRTQISFSVSAERNIHIIPEPRR